MKALLEKRFKCRVVSENSFGVVADYGVIDNIMSLYQGNSNLVIEWIAGPENNPIQVVSIGIWTVGKKVTDYGGVFSLPKEAVALLKEYGLDTTEVEE